MADDWIQKMHMKKGAFTREAKRAGMSVKAYAKRVLANKKMFSTRTVRRATLARTFENMKH